jgi:hypothetical protein
MDFIPSIHLVWIMTKRPATEWIRWILVLPSAVAGLVVISSLNSLVLNHVSSAIPRWPLPFTAALAWVTLGVIVAPRRRFAISAVLYIVGAIIAWWIMGGLVVWPYNSWAELAAAFIGGGIGILVAALFSFRKSFLPAVVLSVGLVVASSAFAVGTSYIHLLNTGHAWGEPGTLFTKNAEGKERNTDARYVRDSDPSSNAIWIWTRDTNSAWYAELFQQRTASFEWDSGSGGTPVKPTKIDDVETRGKVEALLIESLRGRRKTLIPLPKPDLSKRILIRLDAIPYRSERPNP